MKRKHYINTNTIRKIVDYKIPSPRLLPSSIITTPIYIQNCHSQLTQNMQLGYVDVSIFAVAT